LFSLYRLDVCWISHSFFSVDRAAPRRSMVPIVPISHTVSTLFYTF
jgi:hypothetical protein